MKKLSMLLILAVAVVFFNCSKKDDPAPTSQVNERLTAVSSSGGSVTLSYDDQGRVKAITGDNGESFDIYYLANDISGSMTGDPPLSLKDQDVDDGRDFHIYATTMSNGNPVELKGFSVFYEYNPNTGLDEEHTEEFVIKVTYDNKINPLYLVLDQSKMLPTIDDIVFGSPDPAYASLNAIGLFSVNNPTKVEVFNETGAQIEDPTTFTYQYDAAGCPTKATSSEGGVVNFIYTPK